MPDARHGRQAPEGGPAAAIDAFLRAGGSVCVPALRAAIHGEIDYTVLPGNGDLQGPVYVALRNFLRANALAAGHADRKTVCMLVDGTPDITPAAQRERAMLIREEIHVAMARLDAWLLGGERWHRAAVRKQLAENEFPGVNAGTCRGRNIVRFAMGPHYPPHHRRFLPQYLAVPVTTGQDAGWYHEHRPNDVRRTLLNITERCGEMLGAMSYYEEPEATLDRHVDAT